MGVLERLHPPAALSLSSRHIVGRARACQLRLDRPTVSGAHALIEWTDGRGWYVRDLGSKNGTFVDGRRLAVDVATPLAVGARVAFGGESDVWKLVDEGQPGPAVQAPDASYRLPDLGMIALPSPDDPRLTIFIEDGRCFVDAEAGRVELTDGAAVYAGSSDWKVLIPELLVATVAASTEPSIRELALDFVVSRNEENVELSVRGGGVDVRIAHRSHNYMLLTLARMRIDDAKATGLPASEHGWVDSYSLKEMLRIDPEQLNLQVFRARRQLAELGVRDAPALIERRSGARQLRIGIDQLTVSRA